ncbi:MAG TPA: acetolactate synthase small subunit [Bacteroidales bacterium]|jgi:acetolactate synthase-1/3 small subunit|nr:acetolactate synthase small subunit [Bacteroidales bacterium]HOS71574.1 acetolactate synthase small subunit [Bacteroidales bacterium]HQH22724.1 acetolactate synthase small subunit [Bacteroidales bacterium]HQJ82108.1 acetolactate synthase small subunit [Bacteroidales bacterium]
MKQEFTISIFSENHIGILNQITIILTRRQVNIESLTASESAVKGVHLLTLVVEVTPDMVRKISRQIEKLVEVLKVFVHTSDQIIYQEIALFKVSAKSIMTGDILERMVKHYNARILVVSPEYIVIEKTGHKSEINELLEKLETYGVLQFARSGRVAITKQVKELTHYLKELDEASRKTPGEPVLN